MDARKPLDVAKKLNSAKKAAKDLSGTAAPEAPGAPGSAAPAFDEPTTPQEPLPAKPEQSAPEPRTPTGAITGCPVHAYGQQGSFLTTSNGTRLRDTDHSLKAGPRGPVLLQDHHFREKITHFDHERIPERVVHARGAGAHGVFIGYGNAATITRAGFLAEGKETPVFVRFSTVLGSRGSADTVRDTRGFATKFYTDEGTFDLVGNNIPVFFIQDAIKFPDVIHAAKPHPDREIPQAQSAHDTFWDFVSLHTEAQHHTIWNMSDRGIPRSYRTMEGFGVHTFRLVDQAGDTVLVKFHWKPKLGVHSLTWEEAQLLSGVDPDFHRRDLYDAIEAGAFPEWELGLQIFPDTAEETFAGIDLLDATKLVPEELAPVQPVGRLLLNRVPTNFFAESEQVAFHLGNLPPGIDVTNDPLLQGRLFSYVDTQLTRLGGPNFAQIPINRPHTAVNDLARDGFHQHAIHGGVAPYRPNSLDGGNPFEAGDAENAFLDVPVRVAEAPKIRANPTSFDDHFSQARVFWQSMTAVEREHIIAAYTFELAKCYEETIKQRQLHCLAQIDPVLCEQVALGIGLAAPQPETTLAEVTPSPALSQLGGEWPTDGRVIGIVAGPDGDLAGVTAVREAVLDAGMTPLVIAPHGGKLGDVVVQRTFDTARSVEFDALLLADAPAPAPSAVPARDAKAGTLPIRKTETGAAVDPRVLRLIDEAWRHAKAVGAWSNGVTVLNQLDFTDTPGVITANTGQEAFTGVHELLASHRVWQRFPTSIG